MEQGVGLKKDFYTIYLKKSDFDFVEKEVGAKNIINFEGIKDFDDSQYEINISESELDSFAQLCAHACDYIKSDRKAQRLDNIALMLENWLDQF